VNVKDLDERVQVLDSQISEIESDNKQLKDKLDSTNSNVGLFISEMSTLLDTHELQSVLNMEVDSDEEEDVGRMLDVEYEG
jgi:peptidoglycan hydrolase CwlO-like protein